MLCSPVPASPEGGGDDYGLVIAVLVKRSGCSVVIEVVVEVVASMVNVGELELGSDGRLFITKAFGGRLNVVALVVRVW